MKEEHTIIPTKNTQLFQVKNNLSGDVYKVDTSNRPSCTCLSRQFKKKNKKGIKGICKHIRQTRGYRNG